MRPLLFPLKSLLFCGLLFLAFAFPAKAQTGTEYKVLVVSPHVGEVIDVEDRKRFGLFPATDSATFMVARFLEYPDGRIVLETIRTNGKTDYQPYTRNEFNLTGQLIQAKAAMVQAPQPATPAQPSPAAPATTQPPADRSQKKSFGRDEKVYYVILSDGQKMFVTIQERRETEISLNTLYNGTITVPLSKIRYLKPALQGSHDEWWIPNAHDSRLFFGPTGRGIPRGEGYVQFIDVYLVAANVGITDNISIGGMTTILPFLPLEDQILFFTPKVSFKTSAKTSVSTGVLLANAFEESFGLAYTAGTYGNANDHVTVGLGFEFMNEDIGNRPVIMLGATKRVSNRIGLMTENYFVPVTSTDIYGERTETMAMGLYGMRLIWPKGNLDLGAGYVFLPESEAGWDGRQFYSTYVFPIFISYSVRLGNRRNLEKLK